jgi:predicted ribosomally synthesized peptide with SipW-like signal peptide
MKKRKIISITLILALVAIMVSGTIAYFTDKTKEVKNTFETAELDIKLWENDAEFTEGEWTQTKTVLDSEGDPKEGVEFVGVEYTSILPGMTLPKNPTVTVVAPSTEAYVLVEVRTSVATAKALGKALIKLETEGVEGEDADSAYAAALELTDFDAEKWELIGWTIEDKEVTFLIAYSDTVTADEDDVDLEIFSKIVIPAEFDNEDMAALNESYLVFKAYAVQAYQVEDVAAAAEILGITPTNLAE